MAMSLTSSAFQDGGSIPPKFTCDGEREISPALSISGVPEGTASLVLVMDDPDIPAPVKERLGEEAFDHWIMFDIAPSITEIVEGGPPAGGLGTLGRSSTGKNEYTGPCPPREYEPSEHRYIFRLYALNTKLGLPAGATKAEVLAAMKGHVMGDAELLGRYRRAGR